MGLARLLYKNIILDAAECSLSASAAATGYAVSNLRAPSRRLPYRSTTTTGTRVVEATYNVARWTVRAVALVDPVYLGINGGAELWATLQGSGGISAKIGDFPAVGRNGVSCWHDDGSLVNVEVLTVKFTNPDAVSDYCELGALYAVLGDGEVDPSVNVTDDLGVDPVDPSEMVRMVGGEELTWRKAQFEALTAQFRSMPAAFREDMLEAFDYAGSSLECVFAYDRADMDTHYYGKLGSVRVRHATRDQWHVDVPFREVV